MGKWRQARGPISKACMNFDFFCKRSLKTRVTLFTLPAMVSLSVKCEAVARLAMQTGKTSDSS